MRHPAPLAAVLLVLGCSTGSAPVELGPALGTAINEAHVAAWDIDVAPDGVGLPEGSGTAAEGEPLYANRCAHCHGVAGTDGLADPLTGEGLTVGTYWPYATTLFDYVRRAMPYETPGSLTSDELYALTAYVLHLNGIVDRGARLDRTSLPDVEMPNRQGFRSDWDSR